MAYRVLSMDGGGMAGLFTARLLDRLATEYPALLPKADLLAGTSTGGIIALGLAGGRTPAELADLYELRGKEIFDDSWWDDIRDLGKAVGADYSTRNAKKVLDDELGASTTLRQLAKRVLIPTFDLDPHDAHSTGGKEPPPDEPRVWKPKFFHNFPGNDSDGGQLVVDVALRTSAAPTYFPAYQGYIDGGMVANNPSMAALATALDARCGDQDLGDVVLLSISSGTDPKYLKGENLNWGWGQWARPLVSIMISGVMGVAHFQCKQILGDRYRRLDRVLDRAVQLDDVRPKTLEYLKQEADAIDLTGLVQWLRQKWV
jgi:patatin-like phospholipase/acyl hydrolase